MAERFDSFFFFFSGWVYLSKGDKRDVTLDANSRITTAVGKLQRKRERESWVTVEERDRDPWSTLPNTYPCDIALIVPDYERARSRCLNFHIIPLPLLHPLPGANRRYYYENGGPRALNYSGTTRFPRLSTTSRVHEITRSFHGRHEPSLKGFLRILAAWTSGWWW